MVKPCSRWLAVRRWNLSSQTADVLFGLGKYLPTGQSFRVTDLEVLSVSRPAFENSPTRMGS